MIIMKKIQKILIKILNFCVQKKSVDASEKIRKERDAKTTQVLERLHVLKTRKSKGVAKDILAEMVEGEDAVEAVSDFEKGKVLVELHNKIAKKTGKRTKIKKTKANELPNNAGAKMPSPEGNKADFEAATDIHGEIRESEMATSRPDSMIHENGKDRNNNESEIPFELSIDDRFIVINNVCQHQLINFLQKGSSRSFLESQCPKKKIEPY